MARVFVEARPKGRPEGSLIEDYVAEDHADHVLQTFKTQHEAIEWAKKTGHTPHVARVRHLNDKEKPDHWRATALATGGTHQSQKITPSSLVSTKKRRYDAKKTKAPRERGL